jgi:hypothetical protein
VGVIATVADMAGQASAVSISDWRAAQRYLLAHLRVSGTPMDLGVPSATGWREIGAQALDHRIPALAYRRLTAGPAAASMPEAIASSLREAYALSALRNARLFRETAFAVSALSEAGIPTLLLKGLHLASEVYEEPALRSMADLDLMVPLPQLAEAERVLLNRGYGSRPRRDVAAQARRLHHLAWLEHPTGEIIELHHTIEAPTSPFRIESETLWAGARQIQIEDVAAYVLSDEHLLLHLCLHLSYHHGFRRAPLKGLVDLATLLEAAGARFRWSEVVTCSRAWGTDRFVYSTLKLARQVLGAPVPSDVLTDIPHEPLDDEIVETAARFVLAPPLHRHISGSLPPEPGDPARRTRFLRRGAWPPRGQLRSQYGRPVGGILRLHVRRARDLMRRRACILLRAVVRPDCRHRVTSYLFDAGRIATWIEEAA